MMKAEINEELAYNIFRVINRQPPYCKFPTQLKLIIEHFIFSVHYLFLNGSLIKKIVIGSKTFLTSHGGTIHKDVFNITKLKSILGLKDDSDIISEDYNAKEHNALFESVMNIMNKDLSDVYPNHFENIENYRKNFEIESESESGKSEDFNINESIQLYNNLLAIYSEIAFKHYKELNEVGHSNPSNEAKIKRILYEILHILIALGLKSKEPKHPFISPIESCGVNSCTHFTVPSLAFIEFLKENKIDGCVHGHKPFCGTVPLIFKKDSYIEIACDTSNGGRPKNFSDTPVELENVPLAIIFEEGAGITSVVKDDEKYTLSNKKTLGLSSVGKDERFKPMIGFFEFGNSDFPHLITSEDSSKPTTQIQYPGRGVFNFNGTKLTPFEPSTFDDSNKTKGGKKTKRNNKKNQRKTKKNRKTKNKKNKNKNKKGKTKRSM
jgi:hypothetical protein